MKSSETHPHGLRWKLSIALFGLSIVVPLFGVPIVAVLNFSRPVTASISGALLAAGELLGLAAVAVVGKPGYALIKKKILGMLRHYGPPRKVSRLRYRIGLVMFGAPLAFAWISPYAGGTIPGFQDNPLLYALGGDILFLSSLVVLGGDFWDKLRSLFVHDAEIRYRGGPKEGNGRL